MSLFDVIKYPIDINFKHEDFRRMPDRMIRGISDILATSNYNSINNTILFIQTRLLITIPERKRPAMLEKIRKYIEEYNEPV